MNAETHGSPSLQQQQVEATRQQIQASSPTSLGPLNSALSHHSSQLPGFTHIEKMRNRYCQEHQQQDCSCFMNSSATAADARNAQHSPDSKASLSALKLQYPPLSNLSQTSTVGTFQTSSEPTSLVRIRIKSIAELLSTLQRLNSFQHNGVSFTYMDIAVEQFERVIEYCKATFVDDDHQVLIASQQADGKNSERQAQLDSQPERPREQHTSSDEDDLFLQNSSTDEVIQPPLQTPTIKIKVKMQHFEPKALKEVVADELDPCSESQTLIPQALNLVKNSPIKISIDKNFIKLPTATLTEEKKQEPPPAMTLDDLDFNELMLALEEENGQPNKHKTASEDHGKAAAAGLEEKKKLQAQVPGNGTGSDLNFVDLNVFSENLFHQKADQNDSMGSFQLPKPLDTLKKAGSQMNSREQKTHLEAKAFNEFQARQKEFRQMQTMIGGFGGSQDRSNLVDLLFLHASPNQFKFLIQQPLNGANQEQKRMLPALDFKKEKQTIKDALTSSGKRINFQSKVATKANFEETIRRKPLVLHISCHGVKIQPKVRMMSLSSQSQFDGQYLLFENSYGDGELVSAEELSDFTKKSSKGFVFSVVFVAACDSEDVGRVFLHNGAKHVVCVEQGRKVLDEAAIQFTQTFYNLLFNGEQVCTAFDQAKYTVSFKIKPEEASLFKLLKQHGDSTQCQSTGALFEAGSWQCLSDHLQVKTIPAKLEKCQFREKDMSQLLQKILQTDGQNRIVVILGLYGIGKSTLAKNTLHYASDRKYFKGGIVYVQLKDVRESFIVLKLTMQAIIESLELDDSQRRSIERNNFIHEAKVLEFLVNFFNNKHGLKLSRRRHSSQQSSGRDESQKKHEQFLLCLDNVSALIEHDTEFEFVNLLGYLQENCPKLHIIITTNRSLGVHRLNEIKAQPFLLQQLQSNESVNLFLNNCGQSIDWKAVLDLLLQDENFPYNEFLPSVKEQLPPIEITESLKSEIGSRVRSSGNWPAFLARHDLFRNLLHGNPTSITMMAAVNQNPMINCSLSQMYKSLKEEKKIKVELTGYDSNGQLMPPEVENIMSVNVTAEMSVQLIESMGNNDIHLLFFLGCLPGGITLAQLSVMWTTWTMDAIRESLQLFEQLSLLESSEERKVLIPTMFNFIENNIELRTKWTLITSICQFYIKLLQDSYEQIGLTTAQKSYESLQQVPDEQSPSLINGLLMNSPSQHSLRRWSSDRFSVKKQSLQENLQILGKKKSILAELANELRNIEYCVVFFADLHEHLVAQNTFGSKLAFAPAEGSTSEKLVNCASHNLNLLSESNIEAYEHDELISDVNSVDNFLLNQSVPLVVDDSALNLKDNHGQSATSELLSTHHLPNQQRATGNTGSETRLSSLDRKSSRIRVQQSVKSMINKAKNCRKRRPGLLSIGEKRQLPKLKKCGSNRPKQQILKRNLSFISEEYHAMSSQSASQGSYNALQSSFSSASSSLSQDDRDFSSVSENSDLRRQQNSRGSDIKVSPLHSSDVDSGSPRSPEETKDNKQRSNGTQKSFSPEHDSFKTFRPSSQSDFSKLQFSASPCKLVPNHGTDKPDSQQMELKLFVSGFGQQLPPESPASIKPQKVSKQRQMQEHRASQTIRTTENEHRFVDSGGATSSDRYAPIKRHNSMLMSHGTREQVQPAMAVSTFGRSFRDVLNEKKQLTNKTMLARDSSHSATRLANNEVKLDRFTLGHSQREGSRGRSSIVDSMTDITQQDIEETQALVDQTQKQINRHSIRRRFAMSSSNVQGKAQTQGNNNISGSGQTAALCQTQPMLEQASSSSLPKREEQSKSAGSSVEGNESQVWEPMRIEGKFIILCAANTYLTNQFEQSLRISTQDFSSVDRTGLFEGNLLRFRALASLKLFEHGLEERDNKFKRENFTYLTKAIASLENALEIYRAKELNGDQNQNEYGVALSMYTLGYTYLTYADFLCIDGVFQGLCEPEHFKYLVTDRNAALTKAEKYFSLAYMAFEQVGHLAGMFMSKKREQELQPANNDPDDKVLQLVQECSKRYFDFCSEHGIDRSCHTPREHGPDISIMTEVIFEQSKTGVDASLFAQGGEVPETRVRKADLMDMENDRAVSVHGDDERQEQIFNDGDSSDGVNLHFIK